MMTKTSTFLTWMCLLTIAGAISDARAQSTATRLEEIVVTAQKREQSIQDVPIAITALQGEDLEALGAEGLRTFANRTPGLQLIESSPLDTQIVIRGVVSSRVTSDQVQNKPTVGVYVDDVPMEVAANNHNFQLFDLERIEVLRGPQGALFGAGAMGGAIRYVTRKASTDIFSGSLGVRGSGTESGKESYAIDGVINLPIVKDKLGARLLAYKTRYGGFLDNSGTSINNANDVKVDGFRAAVKFTPKDWLSVNIVAARQNTTMEDSQNYFPTLGDLRRYSAFPERADASSDYFALTAEIKLNSVSLVSVTGYQKKDGWRDFDVQGFNPLLGLPLDLIRLSIPTRSYSDGFTQELRVESDDAHPLRWTVGGFFSRQKVGLAQSLIAPGIEALGFPPGSDFGVSKDYLFDAVVASTTKQYALFGQLDYKISERLTASLGARYFDAKDRSDFTLGGLLQGGAFSAQPALNENGINPSASIDFKVSDNVLLYTRVAKGFRIGGGNNPIPQDLCGADLAAIGFTSPPTTFKSDSLWNYEVGVKSKFAGGRATLNAATYLIDWKNLIVQTSLRCGFAAISNAGRAKSQGIELEGQFAATESLSFFGYLNLLDSKLSEDVPRLQARDGQRVPYVPRFQGSIGFDFSKDVANGKAFLTADTQYVGSRDTSLLASANLPMDSYSVVGVRTGFRTSKYEVQLFAENLANKRGQLARSIIGFSSADVLFPGAVSTTVIRPRTVGLQARINF